MYSVGQGMLSVASVGLPRLRSAAAQDCSESLLGTRVMGLISVYEMARSTFPRMLLACGEIWFKK